MRATPPITTLTALAHHPLSLMIALLALSSALLVSCAQKVDIDQLQKTIQTGITQQTGIAVDSVGCPQEDRKLAERDTFNCNVNTQGGPLTVQVTLVDNQGKVTWKVTQGLVSLTLAEEKVQAAIGKRVGIQVMVDCGSKKGSSRVAHKGDVFECSVTDGKQTLPIKVTMQDDQGGFAWEPIHP
ncbi:hypothetical protein BST81_14710 [Leptolyngbya sp. 'hensonii']|uniref:DUF4333 domain-containing protein n=1 Tax=Leptolyngbya sp. 'hensonii' TaxID=1922337 RepID=UPI0009687085|nr:DUF4333 domain-containing protein [Leptolyngbya sp. 'hensonii']OLP17577.1 hypothetical protein BST81_14710 [Leptolyngbya sp. 'hensonii']